MIEELRIQKLVFVSCDGDDGNCPDYFQGDYPMTPFLVRQMKAHGWVRKSGKRFCPNCVERFNIKGGF